MSTVASGMGLSQHRGGLIRGLPVILQVRHFSLATLEGSVLNIEGEGDFQVRPLQPQQRKQVNSDCHYHQLAHFLPTAVVTSHPPPVRVLIVVGCWLLH